jgi:hypothetical protein
LSYLLKKKLKNNSLAAGVTLSINSNLNIVIKKKNRLSRGIRGIFRSITFSKNKAKLAPGELKNYKFINFFSSLKT